MKLKICLALFIGAFTTSRAQEVTVKINGGLQGVDYSSPQGSGNMKPGGGLGVGYTYYFSKNWGLGTGLDFNLYRTDFQLHDNTTITSYEVDDQGSAFEYRVTPNGYKEEQRLYGLSIPLMLAYRSDTPGTTGFYFGIGGKVVFPLQHKVDASAASTQLSGYYPDINLEIDDLPDHGFGELTDYNGAADNDLKTAFTASAEAGLYFKLKPHMNLYTGVYVDYGITDLHKSGQSNIVSYSAEGIDEVSSQGVMANQNLLDKSKLFAVGVQVKLGFSLNKEKKTPEPETVVSVVEEEQVYEEKHTAPVRPVEPPKAKVDTGLTTEERTTIASPLSFGSIDNTEVSLEMATRLDRIAGILTTHDELKVTITGHTCNVGSEALNNRIGQQRADAVAEYLQNKGISKSRMMVESKGEKAPLYPNNSSANRSLNRRVTITITE